MFFNVFIILLIKLSLIEVKIGKKYWEECERFHYRYQNKSLSLLYFLKVGNHHCPQTANVVLMKLLEGWNLLQVSGVMFAFNISSIKLLKCCLSGVSPVLC